MAKSRFISDPHRVRDGQRSRSHDTRSVLLDAAEPVLAEKGDVAASVADVSGREAA